MKHISEILLGITQQQLKFQSDLHSYADQLSAMSGSPSSLDTLPALEQDFAALTVMHSRISRELLAVRVVH